ncbi:hypothetical protein B0T25DRAFT_564883 [Lasiosphaeria hispida]|uniref:Uncharacterized protein n=1 Tax=Lasiosphaeria hispida TaxID=260671 RepID=A0AAJ0HRJ0_9PEZI|nr:hypothetical protein B0T25DRAFT_564883 [Lasiosphaeria hispida]
MPHKHTRKGKDLSTFDLPPTQIAKPLPVTSISKKNAPPPKKKGKDQNNSNSNDDPKKNSKRKRGGGVGDDVPRAFKRLMAFAGGKPTKSGLDNGDGVRKKAKGGKATKAPPPPKIEPQAEPNPDLKIRPGERLFEFSQRVDAALPLAGLVNKMTKDGKDPLGLKVKKTKKERKMHKLYDEWREEERKIKEKREEERELAEEAEMVDDGKKVTWKLDGEEQAAKGKKKKGKRTKLIGEDGGKEEDPWLEIIKKRGEAKVGINEVAKAPPELVKMTRKKLLVHGAAVDVENIPKAAGSLRQREELQVIRDDVVAEYRKLMSERRQVKAPAAEVPN